MKLVLTATKHHRSEERSLWGWAALMSVLAWAAMPEAYAALPAVAPPDTSVTAASTDWLAWVRASAKQGTIVLGLLMGAAGLIMMVSKVMTQYNEVGNGRATWGDVAASATGGAVIMMLGAAVLAAAIAVFP